MNKFRKLLKLGHDLGNPFPEEHEWLYNLINSYDNINKDHIYSLITEHSDYTSIRQDFMISILTETHKYYDINKFKDIHASIEAVVSLWRRDPTREKEVDAWFAARAAAAYAATNAAAYAADAAYAAAYAATYAATNAATNAAANAANAATNAAAYAAYAEDAATHVDAAYAEDAATYANAANAAEQKQIELITNLIKKHSEENK